MWTGSVTNDRVLRLNPETGEAVEYLLPRPTNIRRVFVDNSDAGHFLGGQQSRCLDRQVRATDLGRS